MDLNSNEEEPIYQYYTIISNPDTFVGQNEEESEPVVYVTFNQEDEEENQSIKQEIIDEKVLPEELEDTSFLSNLKLITLEDGRMFVTASNSEEENLTTVEPHLISSIDEEEPQLMSSVEEDDQQLISTISADESQFLSAIDEDEEERMQDDESLLNEVKDEASFEQSEFQEVTLEDGSCALVNINLLQPLTNVEKTKTEKKFPCSHKDCGKVYTTAHHLRVHMRSHTGCRPYRCTAAGCDKAFSTGYSLKAHIRTHTGEKPYKCILCQKHFKTSGDLQKHVRIHTGEKPFKCPIENCGRSFTTSNIRKVHIRSHTGERPYSCEYPNCGKAFASATNYKNHMRIHSGEKPYMCPVKGCERRFTEYSSLYKHNAVHQPYKPFTCTYCGQQCKQESTLRAHKRTIHNVVITDDGMEILVTQSDEDPLSGLFFEVAKQDDELDESNYLFLSDDTKCDV